MCIEVRKMRSILLLLVIFLIFGNDISYGNISRYHRLVITKINEWTEKQLEISPSNPQIKQPDKDTYSF